jgi:steroid 5-alpha reductase family enzyme
MFLKMSESKRDYIKLASINLIGYAISYFIKSTYLGETKNFLGYESIVWDNIILSMIFTTYIFIFSYWYNNINMIDFAWGSIGIFFIIESFINASKRKSLYSGKMDFTQVAAIIALLSFVLIYSLRHILIYVRHFPGFKNFREDFRYSDFRHKFGNNIFFWVFSFIFLHIYPFVSFTLAYHPVFYCLQHMKSSTPNLWVCLPGFFLAFGAIFLETIADEQLYVFRKQRDVLMRKYPQSTYKVMSFGLWKMVRHPNYLGEILFFLSLCMFNVGMIGEFKFENVIGFVLMFLLFPCYSVAIMEENLTNKYKEEYKEYQKKVKWALIPYIY